jgi:Cu(I)/Ag(I) efflux system membrane fusion protein
MSSLQLKSRRLIWLLIITLSSLIGSVYVVAHHEESYWGGMAMAAGQEIYTCPMDPQIRQDHPGKCSICGMNLVKSESAESAGAEPVKSDPPAEQKTPKPSDDNATVKYQCPMHPTIVQDHPGDCPICGMKLVKMKNTQTAQATSRSDAPKKIAFYRSPMDPKQTSPVPRKDEMGMDYVPVYESEVSGGNSDVANRAEVTIDPARQQLIGLRTASVMRSDIRSDWHTVGRVQVDPTKVSKINVKVAGFVEQVFVDFVGKPVRRGEPLFTYYSPELLAAQREYLLALKARNSHSDSNDASSDSLMIAVVREKLKLWDVSDDQIERIEKTNEATKALTFASPVSGVVTAKNIVEGSSMNPGDIPYEITDLSSVWVMADAYQADATRVSVGMSASVTLESLPDRVFDGTVAFIDPVLDPQSRTFKVRIDLDNTGGEFKPDMFADVLFQSSVHEALTIPADAIIPSGRGNMVFVALGDGRFQPRAVKLGEKSGDRIEALEGLSEGESVITRANFLVDSESSLRAALAAVGGN